MVCDVYTSVKELEHSENRVRTQLEHLALTS